MKRQLCSVRSDLAEIFLKVLLHSAHSPRDLKFVDEYIGFFHELNSLRVNIAF